MSLIISTFTYGKIRIINDDGTGNIGASFGG